MPFGTPSSGGPATRSSDSTTPGCSPSPRPYLHRSRPSCATGGGKDWSRFMPSDKPLKLTGPMIASLVVLMAQGGRVSNAQMKALAGFTLTGKDRTGLVNGGLITSWKVGQAYTHELTDAGWRTVRTFTAEDRPERAGSTVAALYVVLGD